MKRFDFAGFAARISTWLAVAAASAAGGIAAYATLPERIQTTFPDWTLATLGGIAVGCALLIPVATSFKQKRFRPDDTDGAGA